MKKVLTVLFVALIIYFIINKIAVSNGTKEYREGTYVSSNDSKLKIELTQDAYENQTTGYAAQLYVDGKYYNGQYIMSTASIFKKYMFVDFVGVIESTDDNPNGVVGATFLVKGNKLVLVNAANDETTHIFDDNTKFIKKTWWTIWGKKAVIICFVLWILEAYVEAYKSEKTEKC